MSQATLAPASPFAPADGAGRAAPFGLPLLVAAALGIAFYLTQHDFFISRMEMYGTTKDDLETAAAGGRLSNQVGFILVGLLGLYLLARPGGRPWALEGVLPWLVLVLVAWCLASWLWSIDPPRTFKRCVILMLCFVGALGVARQVSPRDLCVTTALVTAAYAAIGLAAELSLGTFLKGGDYRFAGSLHPNGQGSNCAFLCLSLACLLVHGPARRGCEGASRRGWLLAVLLVGAGLMLLTKSRTACAALLAGLLALRLARPSANLVAAALFLAWLGVVVVLAGLLAGVEVEEVVAFLSLGRAEHVSTLTGRTELWPEILPYIHERPTLGYGYGAFWNEYHIDAVSGEVFWGLSSAHSVYLDSVLSVGLVGAALLWLTAGWGLVRSALCYRAIPGAGQALALALLVYGLLDGVAESDFITPSLETFLAGAGLCRLAFFRPEES